jgi:ABC-type Na+ transport system ATPase subunit NatA
VRVMQSVIDVSGLSKSFGRTRALDGLDLTVEAGEVHGFLGPNGAGKTTTPRILLGLLRADGGKARLLGGDPWEEAVVLHGLDPSMKARAYSKGNRQEVALIAGLAATSSSTSWTSRLPGSTRSWGRSSGSTSTRSVGMGRTILLASHILAEVEILCDRVSIIRSGSVVETGSLAELRHLTRTLMTAETSALRGRRGGLRRGAPRPERRRRPVPRQSASDAGEALPQALRHRRTGLPPGDAVTVLAGTRSLVRLACVATGPGSRSGSARSSS